MDSTHRRTPRHRRTGLRPGGLISTPPSQKPPPYAYVTPQFSQPPAGAHQHSEEDISIASQEHHQTHSGDVDGRSEHSRKSNNSQKKNSSSNSSATSKTNKLNVPMIPEYAEDIEEWLFAHFHATLKASSSTINTMLCKHLGIDNYQDFLKYKEYTAEDYLLLLGETIYDEHLDFLYELAIVIEYCSHQLVNFPDEPLWSFQHYLSLRFVRKANMNSFPNSAELIEQQQACFKHSSPPPYASVSSQVRSIPRAHSINSYHSTAPNMVDETGAMYCRTDLGGDSKFSSHFPKQDKSVASLPCKPKSLADRWDEYEQAHLQEKREKGDGDSEHSSERLSIYKRYQTLPKARPAFGLRHEWDSS